jgi:hypothetical protein
MTGCGAPPRAASLLEIHEEFLGNSPHIKLLFY